MITITTNWIIRLGRSGAEMADPDCVHERVCGWNEDGGGEDILVVVVGGVSVVVRRKDILV